MRTTCWPSRATKATLHADVRLFLKGSQTHSSAISTHRVRCGHGRVETRRFCMVSGQIDWLEQLPHWAGLRSIAMLEETREFNSHTTHARRFFISSLPADANADRTPCGRTGPSKMHCTGRWMSSSTGCFSCANRSRPAEHGHHPPCCPELAQLAKHHFKGSSIKALGARKPVGVTAPCAPS